MSWLVTGGAGYIGAHVVRALVEAGHRVVVLDDLSTGNGSRLPDTVPVVRASVLDQKVVRQVLIEHGVDGVVHVAARKRADESVGEPLRYYRENVEGLRRLLEEVVAAGIERFVFSSSAAVYGTPDVERVEEDHPCAPTNPYGETKLAGEWLVRSVARARPLRAVSLRYFNVAGAAEPSLGDTGGTNLVPVVLDRLTAGQPPVVYGADYPTPDGTCIRDYVHVSDVAAAHRAAADRIDGFSEPVTLNLGRGEGYSVRQVLDMIGAVTGLDATPSVAARRPGDPARVVAATGRAGAVLDWRASRDLREMVESAWAAWRFRHRR
jgi:UDP-glucose 4-epimerase